MPTIATLTMNPALDVSTSIDALRPTHKLRCAAPRFDPGGGGINVAQLIHALGGEVIAVFPSGGPTGATLEALLRDRGPAIAPIPIAGTTRESLTVDERQTGLQYRFVLPGPELAASEQARCSMRWRRWRGRRPISSPAAACRRDAIPLSIMISPSDAAARDRGW
ncbi:MAG: PfkB family carbohydrate kinase [Sphingomonas sp.]